MQQGGPYLQHVACFSGLRPSTPITRSSELFWTRFYGYLGGASEEQKRRIEAARLTALPANGFDQGEPATDESIDWGFSVRSSWEE